MYVYIKIIEVDIYTYIYIDYPKQCALNVCKKQIEYIIRIYVNIDKEKQKKRVSI